MREKLINIMTMCMRSRRMTAGFDTSKSALADGTAQLIIVTSDASAKTEKEIRFFAAKSGTEVIKADFSSLDAQNTIGKKAAVIAVCDSGFAGKIREYLTGGDTADGGISAYER